MKKLVQLFFIVTSFSKAYAAKDLVLNKQSANAYQTYVQKLKDFLSQDISTREKMSELRLDDPQLSFEERLVFLRQASDLGSPQAMTALGLLPFSI